MRVRIKVTARVHNILEYDPKDSKPTFIDDNVRSSGCLMIYARSGLIFIDDACYFRQA